MLNTIIANLPAIGGGIIGICELVGLVLHLFGKPNPSYLSGIITAIKSVPGVKDPGIGQ